MTGDGAVHARPPLLVEALRPLHRVCGRWWAAAGAYWSRAPEPIRAGFYMCGAGILYNIVVSWLDA